MDIAICDLLVISLKYGCLVRRFHTRSKRPNMQIKNWVYREKSAQKGVAGFRRRSCVAPYPGSFEALVASAASSARPNINHSI